MTSAGSPSQSVDADVPVLIVGGSLVGLASAMFLAQHGVETLSVEKHDGTAIHPRAGYFQLRTIELMRVAGIEAKVRAAALALYDPDGGLNAVETLAGREIANYIPNINQGVEDVSPARRLFMPQQVLEPLLLERARELGARFQYATELVGFSQDADGVTATVRDTRLRARRRLIRSRYLVACDGNRSPIRERLGITMRGHGLLSRSVTIYFRADCSHALRGRNLGVIYVNNPRVRGFFRLEKTGLGGFLVVFTVGDINEPGARFVADEITDGAGRRAGARRRRRSRPRGGRAGRRRLARGGRRRRHLPAGPHLPGRRRGPHDAADRWLRRQHRHPGRPQPGLEAGAGASRGWPVRRSSTPTTPSASPPACWPSSRPTTAT